MSVRGSAITAVVAKDLRLFARDRFYLFVSVLGLVLYGALFWLLPASVDETLPVGVHLPGADPALTAEFAGLSDEGLDITAYASAASLADAVEHDDPVAGLDFPEGFLQAVAAGQPATVRLLVAGDAPEEIRTALAAGVRELAFVLAGDEPPVTVPEIDELMLGADQWDGPIPLREQLRPLLVFLVLMTEMLALATLVAAERVTGTVAAILVTPLRVVDLLAAKTALGTVLAFGQALLLAAVTGTLAHAPGVVVVALLLGGLLVTGCGLLAGAVGQDFMSIVFWSMLLLVPLAVPAFAVLFPGTPAPWIRALPTYGLIETLLAVTTRGQGWSAVWSHLLLLAGWCVAAFAAGALALRRRVTRM